MGRPAQTDPILVKMVLTFVFNKSKLLIVRVQQRTSPFTPLQASLDNRRRNGRPSRSVVRRYGWAFFLGLATVVSAPEVEGHAAHRVGASVVAERMHGRLAADLDRE